MKKVLSVFLAALMLFTCFGVMAYAEDGGEIKVPCYIYFEYYTGEFAKDGTPVVSDAETATFICENNSVITSDQMNTWLRDMPKQVVYEYEVEEYGSKRTETVTYTFEYFTIKGHDEGERYKFEGTGEAQMVRDEADPKGNPIVFVANYTKKDTGDTVTFWELVQSIFARINLIFEYFAEIFGF